MRTVTLNIQESSLKLLITNGKRVIRWSHSPLVTGLVRDGVITDPASLGAHIKSLLKEQGSPRGKVLVCVSGVRYIPRVFSVPRLKRHLQREAIRHECERRMPVPLEQLLLSWQYLDGYSGRDRYFVVGIPQKSVKSQVQTMMQAGIRNYSLDLKPLALARAVDSRDAIVLNLESDNADIVLVADGVPEIMRVLPVGGDADTDSEKLREVSVEVIRTVDYYNSNHPERPLDHSAPVFLTGGLALDPSVQTLLQKNLGDRLTSVTAILDCPVHMPAEEYTANIGMTLGLGVPKALKSSASSPAMSVGLKEEGYKPPTYLARKLASVGVVALALALLVPLFQVRSQAHLEASLLAQELSMMEGHLRDAVKGKAPLENLQLETQGLMEERQQLLGTQGRFADRLNVVLRSLPDSMTPDSVKMTDSAVILEGDSQHFSQVIDFASQLEDAGLFSAVYLESLSASETNNSGPVTSFRIRAEY